MSHENDNKAFENGFMSLAVWGLNFTQKQIKFGQLWLKEITKPIFQGDIN